ncbi:MAG: hypothetical protein QOH67_4928 [Hyphomicrobiales bacterium]|nr:hypothetical protein [Hyphomicrobiales bacterium]
MSRLDELDVVLSRRNGKVVASIPALRIFATGEDTASALAALEAKKQAYRSDLNDAGLADSFEASTIPDANTKAEVKSSELRQFALKSAIAVGFVLVAMLVAGGLLASRLDDVIFRTAYALRTSMTPNVNIGGPQFWTNVGAQMDRAGGLFERMSDDDQKKIVLSIRTVVSKVTPIAAEIAPLFSAVRAESDKTQAQNCKSP